MSRRVRKALSKAASATIIVIIIIAIAAGVGWWAMNQQQPSPTTTAPSTTSAPQTTTSAPQTTTQETKPKISVIKIGLIEPLTGSHAVFGIEAKEAAQLAINIINNELGGIKSLGGAKLELVVQDSGESPDAARLAAEKLISQYHPTIVVGAYISRLTAAVAEVTERTHTVLFMDGLVDDLTQHGWKYVFRAAPKASAHGKSAADFILDMAKKKGLKVKTAVVLNEDSVFGTYVGDGAKLELIKNGVKVLDHITYPYDISDVSSLINKIKADNPDVVISVPYFHDAVLIAKAIKSEGIHLMFIAGAGGCGYTDPDSIKAAGDAVLYYTQTYSFNPYRQTEWGKKVVAMFKEKYGKIPTEAGGIILYTMFTIYEGLEKAGQMFPNDPLNPDNLRKAFLSLDLTDSNSIAAQLYPTGHIKFLPNGDNEYAGTAILQVQEVDGTLTPVLVWPEPQPGVEPVFPRPDYSAGG
ncbi:MAG: ABC transporter substrate-binding protein [Desulfurococcales archaeon]|nr:ABC transporter substrate-binding protein [Desulfurococcales archaeon]